MRNFIYRIEQKTLISLLVCASLFFNIFFFTPAAIFFVNKTEFFLFFKDLFIFELFLAGFITLLFTLVISRLKLSIQQKIVSLLLGLSLLLWIEGNFIVWKYGYLDGRAIFWGKYFVHAILDTTLWVLILGYAFVWSSFFYKAARYVALIIVLVQLSVFFIITITRYDEPIYFKYYQVDSSTKFNFSEEKNIIIVVLDEFQSDVFHEMLTSDETYKNIFDGFVYFPNATAGASYTGLAIPAILTGRIYDNSIPRTKFLKETFLNASIPFTLNNNGFTVEVFPWMGWANESIYFNERVANNIKKRPIPIETKLVELTRILDLSFLKSFPHIAKGCIYNNHQWFISRFAKNYLKKRGLTETKKHKLIDIREDIEFINHAIFSTCVNIKRPVFKFYHLQGLHEPLCLNSKFEFGWMKYNRENYIEQAKAYLNLSKKFLDILKENQIYDNSLVFILGDHGSGRSEDMYVNPGDPYFNKILNEKLGRNFQEDKARGIPLILIKPFKSRGEIRISKAPVSLTDVPKTIMSECSIEVTFPGESILEINEDEKRKRYYGAYRWRGNRSDFVEPITLYEISGHSWLNKSWEAISVLCH